MANIKSAKKRIRSSEKKRVHNRIFRSSARTFIKKTHRLIEAGDLEGAETAARQAYQLLDKSARKGILHASNASRRKGRLMVALDKARKAA